MMFLISEVHPFADGNGRIARIMMNAELVAAGEERISAGLCDAFGDFRDCH
jgi:fido (protein-threonine AMPylation protein)